MTTASTDIRLQVLRHHGDPESDDDELDSLLPVSNATDYPATPRRLRLWQTRLFGQRAGTTERKVVFGIRRTDLPDNSISNAKYNVFTFLPLTLYEQFKFFFNLYFLLVALSQFIPALRIGFLSTYVAPLAFVIAVTMVQEASDDLTRRKRDMQSNSERFEVLGMPNLVRASDLRVGDIIKLEKDRRVPADVILLRTEASGGEVFIRTDQLDGETDWKLKTACPSTQLLSDDAQLLNVKGFVMAEPPNKSLGEFAGTLDMSCPSVARSGLNIDHCLWASTVLASDCTVAAMVIYTGIENRQSLNTSKARVKVGLLEQEINNLSKVLCTLTLVLSMSLVLLHTPDGSWYINVTRFVILFSSIIPISLRVNLDLGKNVYAHQMEHDSSISGTIVRTSTIPEDLGRIEYLLTDKTGTLTCNEMELKRLHVGTVSYAADAMEEVASLVAARSDVQSSTPQRNRREIGVRVRDVVLALALCNNVTPSKSGDDGSTTYQAASPDELAIVHWTASVGMQLDTRDRQRMCLKSTTGKGLTFEILHMFPFTSESKRMGIIVKDSHGSITFYEKGADVVMSRIVAPNDWLNEECDNMAREGLRTLVIGKRLLTPENYKQFLDAYDKASVSMRNREAEMSQVVSKMLEHNLKLLGITGVEDKLQDFIKPTLEFLRNAGIKIWMLTGDKVETAKCIAISTKLVRRGQYIHTITCLRESSSAIAELEFLKSKPDTALLIDSESLQFYLDSYSDAFAEICTKLPAVVCCRCSPTQKADVARLIKSSTHRRIACIGDGGNDVSMIQAADIGIGIPGKEGMQAALAADFSVPEFKYLMKLLVWHGRNSYKRSAKLAQFVIHRGLIISVCQIVYSVTSRFAPIALYQGWLMVGYATIYTMMPVFSLALDRDLDESLALLYPELYKDLTKGRSLSYKTFFIWVAISTYQGVAIMLTTLMLHPAHDSTMVAISFSALIINELAMVAMEINSWHILMKLSQVLSIVAYVATIPFLGAYFDLTQFRTFGLYWKIALVAVVSLLPPWSIKSLHRHLRPPDYAKVSGIA